MDLKKVGAYVLITVMSSPLVVWSGQQLLKVSTHEEKIKNLESSNHRLKEQVYQVHWYLIERNGIEAPKLEKRK